MGRMLVAEVKDTAGCTLAGGIESASSKLLGQDAGTLAGIGPTGLLLSSDATALFKTADVVIDFSTPEASLAHARLAAAAKKALVIGTTGFDAAGNAALAEAVKSAPILWAANMSLGVNLLLGLVAQAAHILGEDYDIEILEMHHRHKVDAPSGTALALGQAAAKGRGVDLAAKSQRVRDGVTGPRKAGNIGFATLRGGDNVGEHRVFFANDGEQVELAHRASSRRIFARGAVRAACWLAGKPPGLYAMKDVLGLG
jgi:4-hydroxy-tetrahydrodipicolinate reductase